MVLRTLKLPSLVDSDLRTIAFAERVPKSDIIRLFVTQAKADWSKIKTSDESEDEMVLRSLHLPSSLDDELRTSAYTRKCSKSALIRACIGRGLGWYRERTRTDEGRAEVRSVLASATATG